MLRAPLALSLQPIASITVFAAIWKSPSVRFIAVTILSFASSFIFTSCLSSAPFLNSSPVEISMTIVFSLYSMPSSLTSLINLPAYSGPVSSSLKVCRPKPLCIHWFNMPPSSQSLSSISILSILFFLAEAAAARPAGPPPTITIS